MLNILGRDNFVNFLDFILLLGVGVFEAFQYLHLYLLQLLLLLLLFTYHFGLLHQVHTVELVEGFEFLTLVLSVFYSESLRQDTVMKLFLLHSFQELLIKHTSLLPV